MLYRFVLLCLVPLAFSRSHIKSDHSMVQHSDHEPHSTQALLSGGEIFEGPDEYGPMKSEYKMQLTGGNGCDCKCFVDQSTITEFCLCHCTDGAKPPIGPGCLRACIPKDNGVNECWLTCSAQEASKLLTDNGTPIFGKLRKPVKSTAKSVWVSAGADNSEYERKMCTKYGAHCLYICTGDQKLDLRPGCVSRCAPIWFNKKACYVHCPPQ